MGETGSAYNAMGWFDPSGRAVDALDNHACGGGRGENWLPESVHFYQADFKVLPSEVDKITFEVDWRHWYSQHKGEALLVGGDRRVITMWEGNNYHVLDYLGWRDEDSGRGKAWPYINRVVGVRARVLEDPAHASERLDYDLWFEHTDPRGRKETRRFESSGKQGEEVKFSFAPLRFPVPNVKTDEGYGVDAILESSGSLRARVRDDGQIEVRVNASRWIDGEPAGQPRSGGTGDGGSKVFTVTSGETLRMILPPVPYGGSGVPLSSRRTAASSRIDDAAAVSISNGWVTINNKVFFSGHQDAFILTVTRER